MKHALLANKPIYLEDKEPAKTTVEGTYEIPTPTDLDEATKYIYSQEKWEDVHDDKEQRGSRDHHNSARFQEKLDESKWMDNILSVFHSMRHV